MKKIILALVLVSSPVMAENVFLTSAIEFLSAVAWKDNYKRVPQLTQSSVPRHVPSCRRFMSTYGPGTACLAEDGTWEIIEIEKM